MSRHPQPEALVGGVTNMSEDEEPAAAAGSITQDEREENTLDGFKRRIESCFTTAGHAWFEATRVLEAAEKVLSPRDFSSLAERFKWHYSTVRKFIKIARDPFLRKHEDKLACVDSWTVLHEITKLDEAGRDLFEAEYLSGKAARYITRRQVKECRSVQPEQAHRKLVLATIEADAKIVSGADLDKLTTEIWATGERLSQFPGVRLRISKSLAYLDRNSEPETKKATKALEDAWLEARH
jgi:hypothetical protein